MKSLSFCSTAAVCAGLPHFQPWGMRIQNEQSGSTSLFAQPLAIEAIPEQTEIRDQRTETNQNSAEQEVSGPDRGTYPVGGSRAEKSEINEGLWPRAMSAAPKLARGVLESRLEEVLGELSAPAGPPSSTIRQGHLALLKRWYYRPEAKRTGENLLPRLRRPMAHQGHPSAASAGWRQNRFSRRLRPDRRV